MGRSACTNRGDREDSHVQIKEIAGMNSGRFGFFTHTLFLKISPFDILAANV